MYQGERADSGTSKEVQVPRITEDRQCDLEVKTRIEMARSAFVKLRDMLTSKYVSLNTRKHLVLCYVLSTFLYAWESWTLNKELEGRIEALEMWIYRRLLKISYKDSDQRRSVEQSKREKVVVEDGEAEEGGLFWTLN